MTKTKLTDSQLRTLRVLRDNGPTATSRRASGTSYISGMSARSLDQRKLVTCTWLPAGHVNAAQWGATITEAGRKALAETETKGHENG